MVGILHAGPRPPEIKLRARLDELGCPAILLDVRKPTPPGRFSCVLNRVYPSHVFDAGTEALHRALELVEEFAAAGIPTFNGVTATRCDYSKHASAAAMAKHGIPTPPTMFLDERSSQTALRWPAVVKLDTGGYGRECRRIDDGLQWKRLIDDLPLGRRSHIVQPLIRSSEPEDYRLTVVFGQVVAAYRRTLVDNWLGSAERGSIVRAGGIPPTDVVEIAIGATEAIQANINGVDIIMTDNGPCVIENNPTPGFSAATWSQISADPIQILASAILKATTGVLGS